MTKFTVVEILEALEMTQGKLAKQALLAEHADNELLKEIFQLTSDPYVNFYVAKAPKVRPHGPRAPKDGPLDMVIEALMTTLKKCMTGEMRGNAGKDALTKDFERMQPLEQKWAARIVTRKLRNGIGDGGIEVVWPGLVPSFEVALADKVDWEMDGTKLKLLTPISYPCRLEPKWDGFRCIAVNVGGAVTMFARSGRVFDRAPAIHEWLTTHMPLDTVFDGELMAKEWNDTAEILGSRKNHKDDSSLQYHVFDCLSLDTWKTQGKSLNFDDRLDELSRHIADKIHAHGGPVRIAQGHMVTDETQLLKYYYECLDNGFEGIMVKTFNSPYCFKRSDALMKLKPVVDYDCVVVGVEPGKEETKWDGMFTILRVRLPEGGEATTRVGTGTDDEEKTYIDSEREKLTGRACTVQGQPPISPDGKIRFPRFTRWREEWDCAPEVRALIKEIKGA